MHTTTPARDIERRARSADKAPGRTLGEEQAFQDGRRAGRQQTIVALVNGLEKVLTPESIDNLMGALLEGLGRMDRIPPAVSNDGPDPTEPDEVDMGDPRGSYLSPAEERAYERRHGPLGPARSTVVAYEPGIPAGWKPATQPPNDRRTVMLAKVGIPLAEAAPCWFDHERRQWRIADLKGDPPVFGGARCWQETGTFLLGYDKG